MLAETLTFRAVRVVIANSILRLLWPPLLIHVSISKSSVVSIMIQRANQMVYSRDHERGQLSLVERFAKVIFYLNFPTLLTFVLAKPRPQKSPNVSLSRIIWIHFVREIVIQKVFSSASPPVPLQHAPLSDRRKHSTSSTHSAHRCSIVTTAPHDHLAFSLDTTRVPYPLYLLSLHMHLHPCSGVSVRCA